jgi:4-hydroxy-tetrahydrodipicolinate synthase
VALVTPFTENLEVDYKSLRRLLIHTAKGTDYYVVMGTTGEAATCSDEEKGKVLQFVKDNNPKRLPIVFGIGGNNTASAIEAIKSTDFSGVDALLSVSPYYNKPSQEGIYQHFMAIADVSSCNPIMFLQNFFQYEHRPPDWRI